MKTEDDVGSPESGVIGGKQPIMGDGKQIWVHCKAVRITLCILFSVCQDEVFLCSLGCLGTLCRPGWPLTQRSFYLPNAGTKGMHYYYYLGFVFLFLFCYYYFFMCIGIFPACYVWGRLVPWNWSWQLWAATWVLGTEPESFGRAASVLNHWAISPATPRMTLNFQLQEISQPPTQMELQASHPVSLQKRRIFFNYFKLCVCVCLTMWTRVHTPQMPETKDPHGGRLGNQKSNFSSLEEQEGLSCWAIHQPRGRIQLCGFYCLEQPSFRYDRTDSNKKIISLVKREKFFTSVVLLNVLYWLVGWFWVLFFVLVCLFWIRGLVMCTPVYAQT